MVIGILLIVLSILNILLLILGICLIFTSFYFISVPIFVVTMVLYLVISIIFYVHTYKVLQKEKQNLRLFTFKKCMRKENGIRIIEFKLDNNKWISVKDQSLFFNLDNYLFKKSFIIARIVRELRYPVVSNQLYLFNLFNMKLKIKNIENLIVRFYNGQNIKEYILVEGYISKNTLLSQVISKSGYYDNYLSNRSFSKYMKEKKQINENIYLGY